MSANNGNSCAIGLYSILLNRLKFPVIVLSIYYKNNNNNYYYCYCYCYYYYIIMIIIIIIIIRLPHNFSAVGIFLFS